MPDKEPENTVVLVRRDGSTVRVRASDVEKLKTLDLREQTPREEMEEGISRGIEKYYTAPNRKAATLSKGFLSGLTVGLTDLTTTDEDREEAKYNPGYRLGGELLGGLAGLKVPGVGTAITRGANSLAEATRLGKVGQAGVRGVIEGGAYGAGAALTNAELNGDPITAEAIGAGIGWGSLFGGGLSAIGGGIEARMESRAARKMAERESRLAGMGAEEANALERATAAQKVHGVISEGMKGEHRVQAMAEDALVSGTKEAHRAVKHLEDSAYSRMQSSVQDAAEELGWAQKISKATAAPAEEISFQTMKNSQMAIKSQLQENYLTKEANKFFSKGQLALSVAQSAAKDGKYEKMIANLDKFKDQMVMMETALGGPKFFNSAKAVAQANDLVGLAKYRMETAVKAGEELTKMSALQATLNTFPKTADEFIRMSGERVEKLTAAIDGIQGLKSAELDGVKEALKDAVAHMSERLGVRLEGPPGVQLQGMWKAMKEGRNSQVLLEAQASNWAKMGQAKRGSEEMRMAKEGNLLSKEVDTASGLLEEARNEVSNIRAGKKPSWKSRSMETFLRYQVGKSMAGKLPGGYLIGAGLVTGLMNMKGAILGTILEHAEKWLPKAARGLQKYGPRIEPLATRIDGSPEDTSGKTRKELMAARSREIAETAPGVRDTLYKGLEPLVREHPELAAQMHAQNVARFQFLLEKMPKDPGLAYSNLKSLWQPDAVAVEKFARYYEVFHDPVGVMARALKTGKITLEAAEGLREMNPELWQTLRVKMLERISDPEVSGKIKYDDQIHLGMLLGINLHSTMNPQFISAQQQMYTERNQPLEMSPRIQPGGGAGRPSGPGPSATAGQKVTER